MSQARRILPNSDESSVCELTAAGRGAICVLALSGPAVFGVLNENFRPANGKPISAQRRCAPIYGHWNAEDIIVCLHDESYVEVQCHGGAIAKQLITNDLEKCGFSKTNVPTPEMTATACDAGFIELAKTTTRKTAAILTWQAEGALDREMQTIDGLISEGRLDKARQRINRLLNRSTLGLHLTTPWKIAVAGAANAGKSSLINQVVGYSRSIVFDQPGTTRDLVTVETAIDGWPVELIDTAGLRTSGDQIERQGMALAEQAVQSSELIIEVVDVTNPATTKLPRHSGTRVVVFNKCDIAEPPTETEGLHVSALTGAGIESLLATVSQTLVPDPPKTGDAVPFLNSQVSLLHERLQLMDRQS